MLTLADIDALFPITHDGSIYSDLYKEVYGSRPRGHMFVDVQDFDNEYQRLLADLKTNQEEMRDGETKNFNEFIRKIESVRDLVFDCSVERAIEILADSDDIDHSVYGYEVIEFEYGLGYGSICKWLGEINEDMS